MQVQLGLKKEIKHGCKTWTLCMLFCGKWIEIPDHEIWYDSAFKNYGTRQNTSGSCFCDSFSEAKDWLVSRVKLSKTVANVSDNDVVILDSNVI